MLLDELIQAWSSRWHSLLTCIVCHCCCFYISIRPNSELHSLHHPICCMFNIKICKISQICIICKVCIFYIMQSIAVLHNMQNMHVMYICKAGIHCITLIHTLVLCESRPGACEGGTSANQNVIIGDCLLQVISK